MEKLAFHSKLAYLIKNVYMLLCRYWWSGTTSTTLRVVPVHMQSGTCLSPVSWRWWATTLSVWRGHETSVNCRSVFYCIVILTLIHMYWPCSLYFFSPPPPVFHSCILKCLSLQWLQLRRPVPLMEALTRCVTIAWSILLWCLWHNWRQSPDVQFKRTCRLVISKGYYTFVDGKAQDRFPTLWDNTVNLDLDLHHCIWSKHNKTR